VFEAAREHVAKTAQPAQHGCGECAHQRAIPVAQLLESLRFLVQLLVEGSPPMQHIMQDMRRHPSRFEAGRIPRFCYPHGPRGWSGA
jgi:hypothetical protein